MLLNESQQASYGSSVYAILISVYNLINTILISVYNLINTILISDM